MVAAVAFVFRRHVSAASPPLGKVGLAIVSAGEPVFIRLRKTFAKILKVDNKKAKKQELD